MKMADEREREAFCELKKRMEGQMESDLYEDDNIFYRFLRARDMKVDNAEVMLKEHLEWRKKMDLKNISQFESPEVLKKYFPLNYLGQTKEGHVLRYFPSGTIDSRGLLESCTVEEWAKHQIKHYEEDLLELKNRSKKIGKLVDKFVHIHNLEGFTLSKVTDRKAALQFISFSKMYLDNYPETLKTVYAINAPTIFGILYSMMKAFLPSQVIKKVKIYTDESWKNDLLEIVDAEILPAFLGGKKTDPDGNPLCNTFINHAGLIPKTYYIKNKQSFASLPDVCKVTVGRAGVYEMRLEVEKPDHYLEWEFQLKSGDIQFGIVYENRSGVKTEVVPLERTSTDACTAAGLYKCENVGTCIIIFDNSYSAFKSKDIFYRIRIRS